MSIHKRLKIFVVLFVCLISVAEALGAIYYVDVESSGAGDSSVGDISHPFKSLSKGIKAASPGDTLIIKAGIYDLSGFIGDLKSLTLVGDSEGSTIIENVKRFKIYESLNVSKLKFKNCKQLFYIDLSSNQSINAISIHDCIFKSTPYVIFTSRETEGKISGVNIKNCKFSDVSESEVCTICLTSGQISDIFIENNEFNSLTSTNRGCSAIVVGSNESRDTTKNITIKGNTIDAITGPIGNESDPREVHGVLAYGTNIIIDGNEVRNLNTGQDHEAIYLKASNSKIINNKVEECGSGAGGADISIKGGSINVGNVIADNYIVSSKEGRGMLVNGEATIKYNYIKKVDGLNGIDVYAYEKSPIISNNSVEVKHKGIYVHDAGAGKVEDNYVISYGSSPIESENSNNIVVKNNNLCFGSECGVLPLPRVNILPPVLRMIE